MDNTQTIWVPLTQIRISERRLRSLSAPTVERYRQWLEQGRDPPPVRLVRDGDVYLVRDGRHRVAAAFAAGFAEIKAEVRRIAWLARAVVAAARALGMKLCRLSTSLAPRRNGFDSRRLH